MDYTRELRKFINSQHLYTGVRTTAGVIIPAVILYHFNMLGAMMAIPLGALCVGLTDSPGPFHHRRNSLFASIIINFIVVVIVLYIRTNPLLVIAAIVVFGMFFSLIGVYGSRISSIGLIALLVFIFNVDGHLGKERIWYEALLFSAGGIWYTLLSLLLHSLRPYKLIQQSLGECLIETADYLKTKAAFYRNDPDYTDLYNRLLKQQVSIRQYQDDLREMLFKTRSIVTESTVKGRTLMLMFMDSIDLFERIMTSQQDYAQLHKAFDDSHILETYRSFINVLAEQLNETGLAVQGGFASKMETDLDALLQDCLDEFTALRKDKLNAETIENFIMLRQIFYSLQDITERIRRLHTSTAYDKKLSKEYKPQVELEQFISHQEIDPQLILANLTLQSSNFRHSIRVTLGLLIGYIISLLFPLGHSYWILLTITTILKPAYSITRQRNVQRLAGTLTGAVLGFLLLYFVKDTGVLFVVMILAMIISYSLIKVNYFISTAGITLYVLISIHFLNSTNFRTIISDRVIDTVIGSIIAYLVSAFVLPNWEHEQMGSFIIDALKANRDYFNTVARAFTGNEAGITDYKLKRKNAFVALANLGDTFQRMLSEPKRRQLKMEHYHQFVATSHMLTSYIASLSYYAHGKGRQYASPEFEPLIKQLDEQFKMAISVFEDKMDVTSIHPSAALPITSRVQELLRLRKKEMADGNVDESKSVRKQLSDLKTITGQFELISTITIDEIRILQKINV